MNVMKVRRSKTAMMAEWLYNWSAADHVFCRLLHFLRL